MSELEARINDHVSREEEFDDYIDEDAIEDYEIACVAECWCGACFGDIKTERIFGRAMLTKTNPTTKRHLIIIVNLLEEQND